MAGPLLLSHGIKIPKRKPPEIKIGSVSCLSRVRAGPGLIDSVSDVLVNSINIYIFKKC